MTKDLFPVGDHWPPSVSPLLSSSNGGMRGALTFWGALCKSSKSLLKFISHLITDPEQRQPWKERTSSRRGPRTSRVRTQLSCRACVMAKPVWRGSKVGRLLRKTFSDVQLKFSPHSVSLYHSQSDLIKQFLFLLKGVQPFKPQNFYVPLSHGWITLYIFIFRLVMKELIFVLQSLGNSF